MIFACSTIIFASVGIAASAIARHTRTHSVWVKECIRDRERFGAYHTLIPQLADTDTAVQYLRIDICTFEELLQLAEPYIRLGLVVSIFHLSSWSEAQRTCLRPARSISTCRDRAILLEARFSTQKKL